MPPPRFAALRRFTCAAHGAAARPPRSHTPPPSAAAPPTASPETTCTEPASCPTPMPHRMRRDADAELFEKKA